MFSVKIELIGIGSIMTKTEQVISFLRSFSGRPKEEITLQTRLVSDLGIEGDDGHELLEAFMDEFDVRMTDVDTFNYFDDEPPYSSYSVLLPVVLKVFPKYRRFAVNAWRGRREILIRDLVVSAEQGFWNFPQTPMSDDILFVTGYWYRSVLSIAGLFGIVFMSLLLLGHASLSAFPFMFLAFFVVATVFQSFKLITSHFWLKRLGKAAYYASPQSEFSSEE